MQSVELLLDPATDAAVRAQWAALSAAGLPSQADHRGETNAPHVSVVVADGFGEEAALAATATRLPLPVRLGPPVLLGGRRLVLARLVVADRTLLDLHAATAQALPELSGADPHSAVGRWVPHVTLARGIPVEDLPKALEVLRDNGSGAPDLVGEATQLRRWDSEAKQAWVL